ncbi:LacI family DNA-binding transcriptional regulator [Acrocarpospora macrocephala]|uniref:LacI family transcriptional regulator n=1 Tax=Acrocarpospora macrocephala TaxID=150177 RepID=A0A5M3X4Z0_9ACTN|nr:LacI family DNA-binding transcriptional regulator [Acrocarpospora macrocephala]GES13903.1 LacI family transcriptional regulator [Acrocarpospora macrocephala]
MAGIRDVARLAGVSTATVTRALRDEASVTTATKARVKAAAARLGYVPSAAARALSQGRSNLLGLFVPDIVNPFYAQVAQGLEDRAAEARYHCVITSSHLNPERERHLVTSFQDGTLAGLAITTVGADEAFTSALKGKRAPLVLVDRRARGIEAPLVRTDNRKASREAVGRLLAMGHTRIAMISGPRDFDTASQRLSGFRLAHRDAGRPLIEDLVRHGHLGEAGGFTAMNELLAMAPRPTAVFCFNNLITVGALKAIRAAGLKIPTDISVLAFDDMTLFPLVEPPITAIAQPAYEMGREAADLLLRQIDGETALPDIVLPATLIMRDSLAPPAFP